MNIEIAELKLKAIEQYYYSEISNIVKENPSISQELIDNYTKNLDFKKAKDIFFERIKELLPLIEVVNEKQFFHNSFFENYLFEGAQGILLDQTYGVAYPNVTMSNTTSENAIELIKNNYLPQPEICYITRCYQTRHGNGWMSNENRPISLKNNENETNVLNKYQGNFRTGILDVDLINRAIKIDNKFSFGLKKNISITCLDQVENAQKIPYTINGEIKYGTPEDILLNINTSFNNILNSFSDKSSLINEFKKFRKMNWLPLVNFLFFLCKFVTFLLFSRYNNLNIYKQ